jgi:hypothetical protein
MAARQQPPLPAIDVDMFGVDRRMTPTWRTFWVQLMLFVGSQNVMAVIGETLQASSSYANDAAAAAGGVPVGGLYRNGSVIQVRIV